MSVSELALSLYKETFNNLTANGEEAAPGFVYPWVNKERFIRVPRYDDGFMAFSPATAMVRKDGKIAVKSSYGDRRVFSDVSEAAIFLVEV